MFEYILFFINSIINQCTLHRPELCIHSYISKWVQIRGHVHTMIYLFITVRKEDYDSDNDTIL